MVFKPTFDFRAYRINNALVVDEHDGDGLVWLVVGAINVRDRKGEVCFRFVIKHGENALTSPRLKALLEAVQFDKLKNPDHLYGHVFALKNNGATPDDFATVEYASQCLQSDRDAYLGARKYAADCKAEELGLAA